MCAGADFGDHVVLLPSFIDEQMGQEKKFRCLNKLNERKLEKV